MGYPTIYPTGVTVCNPEKCWNGYTAFQAKDLGATIIDMNGTVVRQIKNLHGFPNKLLPGGYLMGHSGRRNSKYGYQDQKDLIQVDWNGNIVWEFNQWEYIEDPGETPGWMARQHHDYQRAGNPVGYYVPGMAPETDRGNTLILLHKNLHHPEITDKLLCDDVFVEVDWEGNILWEWICSEHFDEFNFSEEAKNTLYRNPNLHAEIGQGVADWMHINSMSVLGPNRWFDNGDQRFHPDNIIWGGRITNIMAITEKASGRIVWQVGPDYNASQALKKMGWVIGQHHNHMIPRGLPGEGNILVFDNGGWAGYGAPNPGSPNGINNAQRDCSRVLEFNPVTLDIVWQYTPVEAGFVPLADNYKFYSGYISSAQRLPNGNTLITEGADGRLFEVTPNHEIVWEYVSPFFSKQFDTNYIYRSYRYPYDYIPQLLVPEAKEVPRINRSLFRVPGNHESAPQNVSTLESGESYETAAQICIISDKK